MYRVKGNIWELFKEYDILCVPFITVVDSLERPVVKDGSFLQEAIENFDRLYRNLIKIVREKDELIKQLLISSDRQKTILSFPVSNTTTLLREKDVILDSAQKLKVYIDDHFNDYFRVLLPPFDYKNMNGYLREIASELDLILDYRFTMVMPEDYND